MSSIIHCNKLPEELNGRLVIIDGKKNTKASDFLRSIGDQLDFPDAETCNWDAYLDWMRDLSWIDEKSVSIIILNYDHFLSEDDYCAQCFLSDFEKVIFPFWENDAMSMFEDAEKIKDVNLFCVNGYELPDDIISLGDVATSVDKALQEFGRVSHQISMPVLRKHEDELYFASFAYYYTAEQIRSKMVKKPSRWFLTDIKTGEVKYNYNCLENDFSSEENDKLYNISYSDALRYGGHYWYSTYTLIDIILNEYVNNGCLRKDLYREYLNRVLRTAPADYRVFYKELSNI